MSDIPETAVAAAVEAWLLAAETDDSDEGPVRAALAAALLHLASAQPQPSKSEEELRDAIIADLPDIPDPASIRAAALDEAGAIARKSKINRPEDEADAGWNCACGDIADAIAALKRGPVAEESGE